MTQYSNVSQPTAIRPLLRSLLQKAVRRGYPDLAQRTALLLGNQGDSTWLRARTGVIVFEECWPNAYLLRNSSPTAITLQQTAVAVKNKDAAGLGSLAHALAEGDATVLDQAHEHRAVKIVAAALKRPEDFFKWARIQCQSEAQINVVSAAQLFFTRASWPWDKAFLLAGAYLSIGVGVQQVLRSTQVPNETFPYWTAIDKHTPQGKSALCRVAAAMHVPGEQLQWASFYFESARSNEMSLCPWWECEARWRLNKIGLSVRGAEIMWSNMADEVKSAIKSQAEMLYRIMEQQPNADSLFPTP